MWLFPVNCAMQIKFLIKANCFIHLATPIVFNSEETVIEL